MKFGAKEGDSWESTLGPNRSVFRVSSIQVQREVPGVVGPSPYIVATIENEVRGAANTIVQKYERQYVKGFGLYSEKVLRNDGTLISIRKLQGN